MNESIRNLKVTEIKNIGHSANGNPRHQITFINSSGNKIRCKTKANSSQGHNLKSLVNKNISVVNLKVNKTGYVLDDYVKDETIEYFKDFESSGHDYEEAIEYLNNAPWVNFEPSEDDEELFNKDGCFDIKAVINLAGNGPRCDIAVGTNAIKIFYSESCEFQLKTYKIRNEITELILNHH